MAELSELWKIRFNKSRNWFELRLPDGTYIPGQTEMKITVADDIPDIATRGRLLATVTLLVEFDGITEDAPVTIE